MRLLFEIGMEENPARFLEPALAELKKNFIQKCKAERILHGEVHIYGTPRRLILCAEEVAEQQEDLNELRSEEHTSELQSRQYLVCRLLLEKKKINFIQYTQNSIIIK